MTEVFIIGEKEDVFVLFSRALANVPVNLTWVGNIDVAEKQFVNEKPDFVFFVAKKLPLLHNWISRYKSFKLNIPFVCFIPKIGWEKRELIWMAKAAQVIELPKLNKEFVKIIESVILPKNVTQIDSNEMTGNLNVFDVIDLIINFEEGKKNGIVELKRQHKIGQLHFNKGKLVNAIYGNKDPQKALTILSTWKTGTFSVNHDNTHHSVQLKLDNKQAIEECQKYRQLQEELVYSLPDQSIVFTAAPWLNYEELQHETRLGLLFFKNGDTLANFFNEQDDVGIQLLENVHSWIKTKKLLQNKEYKYQLYLIKKRQGKSAVRKMLDKILAKEEQPEIWKMEEGDIKDTSLEKELVEASKKKAHKFTDYKYLQNFKEILEKSI